MSLSISNESKNALSISNTEKESDLIWDDADYSWDDAGAGTWDNPRRPLTNESKNALSISNESKN